MSDRSKNSHPLLSIDGIEVVYDPSILGVADVSLHVDRGEIIAFIGANGAGKSTTLKAISGIAGTERARITKGDILLDQVSIAGMAPHRLTKSKKVVHVLEGRHVFSHLTVEENLRSGAFLRKPSRRQMEADIEEIYSWLPRLKDKRKIAAGLCSGGEQQMLAIGRALLTKPELVLLDEPSMGLAPIIVDEVFEIISRLNRELGMSFLVAEQDMRVSLAHAHRAYVVANGHVVLQGSAEDLAARDDLHDIYLGIAEAA
ncbi:ABC transporter ATP-binding protein [Borborobacter arsenicus]|uniref:ABC transporter ATP-binding protein n=1 Tax=Borborobacter arsenicus TaxID=1851146 RepID=UPI001AEC78EC|nr:ABC transporter ATP-binding protein [Pseudaminobacter arsenicus]